MRQAICTLPDPKGAEGWFKAGETYRYKRVGPTLVVSVPDAGGHSNVEVREHVFHAHFKKV